MQNNYSVISYNAALLYENYREEPNRKKERNCPVINVML